MTRKECLEKARGIVTGARYGTPENNFGIIAEMWNAYIKAKATYCVNKNIPAKLDSHDVAAMMAQLKIARIGSGTASADSWIDLAGYAACGCELETEEPEIKWRRCQHSEDN